MATTIDQTKDGLYCPAVPAIDLRTGEQVGWWYGVHIIPETYKHPECWRCGAKLRPTAADIAGAVIEGSEK